MRRVCTIIVATLLVAPAADAADVTRVRLGSEIDGLVAGMDGGAWVTVLRGETSAIGRAGADGRFRTSRAPEPLKAIAVGPDGMAWLLGERHTIYRSDAGGTLARAGAMPDGAPFLAHDLAAGFDGTVWAPGSDGTNVARIASGGAVSFGPFGAPCEGASVNAIEDAPDGAVWFVDNGCRRLVRAGADGTWSAIGLGEDRPEFIAPDLTGGAWYSDRRSLAHTGGARYFVPDDLGGEVTDLTVAPDGTAWAATGTCQLLRATPAGEVTRVPAPIAARFIAFGPSGRWLASAARLVHGDTAEGACDDRGPDASVSPARSISLAALGRRGVRFTVREAAHLSLYVSLGDARVRVQQRAGTLRYVPSRARLQRVARRVAARDRTTIRYTLAATDRDGNTWHTDGEMVVTR